MSEAMIGALRAVLGIDTVAFSKGLKDAEKSLSGFGTSFSSIAKKLAIPAAVTATFGGLALGIKKAIDAADEMGKASEKFGIPTEQLSRLKYAAELSDVSFETLGKGLKNFGVITQQALAQPAGDAAKKLAVLGITIDDIRSKSPEQLFLKAADGTNRLADGFGKVNAVSDAFGKRIGTDLIPLLKTGSKGIHEAGDEAEKLGIVISTKTAIGAQQFNDNMKAIGKIAPGVFQQVAATALPALNGLAVAFKNSALEGSFLQIAVKEIVKFVLEAIFEFNRLAYVIGQLGEAWAALKEQMKQGATFEEMRASNERIAKALSNVANSATIVKEQMNFDDALHSIELVGQMMDRWRDSFGKGASSVREVDDSVKKFIESLKKQQEHQKIDIENWNAAIGVRERLRIIADAEAEATKRKIPLSEEERKQVEGLATAAAGYAVQLAGIATIKENLTPLEAYNQKLKELQQQLDSGAIKADIFARAQAKALKDITDAMLTSLATALGGFGQLFTAFGAHNKKLFEIGKAFAIAEATVNTFKAANQALTAPPGPPLSYVYVAAAIAAGIANIIKIQATQYTGAAAGGSFRVPGGTGAVDTKLVRMQLAPGERVDVTPAARAGGDRALVIPAIKPKDFFTGETVREMVLSIDQWMRDGGTGIRFGTQQ